MLLHAQDNQPHSSTVLELPATFVVEHYFSRLQETGQLGSHGIRLPRSSVASSSPNSANVLMSMFAHASTGLLKFTPLFPFSNLYLGKLLLIPRPITSPNVPSIQPSSATKPTATSPRTGPGKSKPFEKLTGYSDHGFPPALLATKKQINSEAKAIFDGENTFVIKVSIRMDFSMRPLLGMLPYVQRLHIRLKICNLLMRTVKEYFCPEGGS